MRRWSFGAVEVTRVEDPDFELLLPQDEESGARLAQRGWLAPRWVTPEMSLRVGSSAIAIRTPSAVVLVDPWLAFDDPARLAPRLAALRAAGIDPTEVELVINSHIDGVGANAHLDGSPTFPAARYLVPQEEVEDLATGVHPELGRDTGGRHPWLGLLDSGKVEPVDGSEQLLPGLHLERAAGHNRGGVVVWVSSGGQAAVVVGHVFLHPAQVSDPSVVSGDLDPVALEATRRALLERCEAEDALLLGPLFADPGGGKVRRDGDRWRLEPVDQLA
jgi:hypothetical protein